MSRLSSLQDKSTNTRLSSLEDKSTNTRTATNGVEDKSHETYLAIEHFDEIFASFIEEANETTSDNGSFSETFINLSRDVVKGLLTLHSLGFCCPKLSARHIAVVGEDDYLRAKLWNVSKTDNMEEMDENWDSFATMIEDAAKSNRIYSGRVADLCSRIREKELRGLGILKHSAMLLASEQRDQISALFTYAQTFCEVGSNINPYTKDPTKSKVHDELVIFLDKVSDWLAESMPDWIININVDRELLQPEIEDGRSLLYELRSMLEHANKYIPPPDPSLHRADLQEEFWKAWEKHLIQIHKFAVDLCLEY